jgi:hypothetical protein
MRKDEFHEALIDQIDWGLAGLVPSGKATRIAEALTGMNMFRIPEVEAFA